MKLSFRKKKEKEGFPDCFFHKCQNPVEFNKDYYAIYTFIGDCPANLKCYHSCIIRWYYISFGENMGKLSLVSKKKTMGVIP